MKQATRLQKIGCLLAGFFATIVILIIGAVMTASGRQTADQMADYDKIEEKYWSDYAKEGDAQAFIKDNLIPCLSSYEADAIVCIPAVLEKSGLVSEDFRKKVSAEMSKSFDMKSRDIVATHRAKIKEMALDSIR